MTGLRGNPRDPHAQTHVAPSYQGDESLRIIHGLQLFLPVGFPAGGAGFPVIKELSFFILSTFAINEKFTFSVLFHQLGYFLVSSATHIKTKKTKQDQIARRCGAYSHNQECTNDFCIVGVYGISQCPFSNHASRQIHRSDSQITQSYLRKADCFHCWQ